MRLSLARYIDFSLRPFIFLIIIILFAISNVTFSQGRRDRLNNNFNNNNNNVNPNDTSKVVVSDTTLVSDTTKTYIADSTARVKYFKYVPEYSFGTKLPHKTSPLLLDNSSNIKYDVSFDTANNVIIREQFDGEDIRAPLVLTLDQYIKALSDNNVKNVFSQIVSEKFQGNTKDDISQLFEKFTDITIPLPFKSESIFGPPTFNLKINGAVDITASYQNSTSEQQSTYGISNSNNSINFKQEVQLTAKGKIGDKLTIDADYNTQRLFDFENQLKIKYEGYADEVIKRIEGGNVSLQTNSGLIGSSQALFGVVGDFQLGNLSLSTVVSQKKSKTEVKDYSGGAAEQTFDIKVWDYSDNHYLLDTIYKASFLDYYNNVNISQQTNLLAVDDQSIEVWVQTEPSTNGYRKAAMIVDLPPLPAGGKYPDSLKKIQHVQDKSEFGLVRLLTTSEYSLNRLAGYISLKISIPENYFVGVAYKRTLGNQEQYGTISTDTNVKSTDTLILKMVKAPNVQPNTLAWELKLKNIYRLPVSKVVKEGFDLNVNYLSEGIYKPTLPIQNLNSYLITLLGLDKYSNGRSGTSDNKFDFLPGYTIDPENGFIIFPTLKPFLDTLKNFNQNGLTIDSSFYYPEIYTQLKSNSKNLPNANNYNISGKARGEAGISNTISLGFNIVLGSVKVKIGERELSLNTDYVMDYSTGTLTIRNPEALISRDLKITYESNDLFTLASKTFLGMRGEYKISDKSSFGFTYVNLKQETLNDKVRLGEEPTNNSMYGVDFTTSIPSKFLTNVVNLLPGFNSKEPSSISFRGELAAINPDPNTKKSVIPQDNNEAVAYIDDMEGAKKVISLGVNPISWTTASVPLDQSYIANTSNLNLKQDRRGKLHWFTIVNSIDVRDIYPLKDVQSSQSNVSPLFMIYNPKKRGTYNYNGSFTNFQYKDSTWNGIMKYLNTTSNDLVSENVNFIEFSMQIIKADSTRDNGKLIIDLGNISKDAIPDDVLTTEDSLGNNQLRTSDDIGLDYKTNLQEDSIYKARNGGNSPPPSEALDPGQDDYSQGYNENGTQGNGNVTGFNIPDTEDLNKTGTIRNGNDYFQFEVSLDTVNNPYIVGVGKNGWRQYKIPLSEYKAAYGNATLTNISFARMWITGVTDSIALSLYDVNLTGNQWVKLNKLDTTYNITVVSIEENSDYTSPIPGDVLRQTVRGQNNVNTLSNEQSLSLEVVNLGNGVRKTAKKDFSTAPLDLLNYRQLKLFVNGDPHFNYTSSTVYDASMIVRIGNDSNNYYEYRAPIHPETQRPLPGDQPWLTINDITINFNDLTKLKIARTDSSNVPYEEPDSTGPPGAYYKVLGNPDLQTVREIILGVEKNRNSLNASVSGSVWFNELRVVNVVDNSGVAMNLSANVKLADLMELNLSFSKTDPFFHGLDGRVGTRTTGIAWDFSATIQVHKFINNIFSTLLSEEWGNFITLPVTFRHSENLINPRYYPGTDIELDKAADERYQKVLQRGGSIADAELARDNLRKEAQTLSVRNSLSISNLQFNLPSNNFLIKGIFNQLRFNFNTDFGNSRDLTYENKDDFRYNGGISIATDFGLSDNLNIGIGTLLPLGERYKSAKLYFAFPFIPLVPLFSQNINAASDFNRSQAESKQRRLTTNDFTTRDFRATRGFRFDWKLIENWIVDLTGNYDFRAGSDLTPLETDSNRNQKPGGEIFNEIFFNNGFVNFGKDLDYTQTVAFNPKFNFPFIDKFMTVNGNYNVRYGWLNPNQAVNIGFNTTYANNISGGANFKLKELFSIFGGSEESKLRANGIAMDTLKQDGNKQSIADILNIFKSFFPTDISVNYSQSNAVSNQGVGGLPGFGNFWFYPSTKEQYGPSRAYQLGLSLYPGRRVANLTNIGDSYAQTNELSFSTTINPILPEAITMSLNFKTDWGFINSLTYSSDSIGNIGNPSSKTSSMTNGRTMFFAGDIAKLEYDYDAVNTSQNTKKLSDAFRSKIASFPFPNWNINISGLEKFPLFTNFANSVTLENSFISEYKESRSININGLDIPNAQAVTQSFTPFLGLNFNFKEVWGGNLTSTFRLNKSITSALNPTGALVQTIRTNEWSINANFAKTGFSIPLFGLSLQNDISFALTISRSTNEPINYEFGLTRIGKPVPGNGSITTTFNPTIQYSLSSKVSMQFFYKYIKTDPTGQTLTTVPRKTNEGGLNIKISIQ